MLLLGGCKIERTPSEYIDRRGAAATEREEAAAELRSHVAVLAQSLSQGSVGRALAALSPAPDVRVLGPKQRWQVGDAADLRPLLEQAVANRGTRVEPTAVEVQIGPRGDIGWFAARFRLVHNLAPADSSELRLSGVYLRDEGVWRLMQAHLSGSQGVLTPLPPPADSTGPE